jgi:fructose-1,6-bisphosphatase I
MDGKTLNDHIAWMDEGTKKIILTVAQVSADLRYDFATKRGAAETKNAYGETQETLDVWADGLLTDALMGTGEIRALISEEKEEPTMGEGEYVVSMDPLDGSSNIKSNNIFGTIIGIYKGAELGILNEGNSLQVAFYIAYGPLTSIVMATKKGVCEYAYDDRTKKYYLIRDGISLPSEGTIYSAGGGYEGWEPKFQKFIDSLVAKKVKLRYGGSFVGDINQVLNYGGIFCYPVTQKKPEGKLRLIIECIPMAFIIAKAGGAASNGKEPILSMQPEEITQRIPIYIGSKNFVEALEKALSNK